MYPRVGHEHIDEVFLETKINKSSFSGHRVPLFTLRTKRFDEIANKLRRKVLSALKALVNNI